MRAKHCHKHANFRSQTTMPLRLRPSLGYSRWENKKRKKSRIKKRREEKKNRRRQCERDAASCRLPAGETGGEAPVWVAQIWRNNSQLTHSSVLITGAGDSLSTPRAPPGWDSSETSSKSARTPWIHRFFSLNFFLFFHSRRAVRLRSAVLPVNEVEMIKGSPPKWLPACEVFHLISFLFILTFNNYLCNLLSRVRHL